MPPKDDVSAEYDAGPVGNLENPGPYIAQVSKQTKFALTCKDDEGDRIRVAVFEHPLRGFPHLQIEHNEDELKRDKIYTKDRLHVTAKVRSIREPSSPNSKLARHALVIVDYQLGDEIYPAGLSFIADLAEGPNAYEGGRGTQLRASSELPTIMRPKIRNEYGEFNVTLNKLKIDRVTGDTTLTMSWFLVPALHIKHKCQISKQPDKDAAIMIGEAFEGMKAEIKRITKKGVENRL